MLPVGPSVIGAMLMIDTKETYETSIYTKETYLSSLFCVTKEIGLFCVC